MDGYQVDVFLIYFAIVVLLALLIPEILHRLNVAPIPLFIIAGMVIGPHGLGIIEMHPALYDIGRLGLLFLVFLAGLDARSMKTGRRYTFVKLVIISGLICFVSGYLMADMLGFPLLTSLLFGSILMSSSVGEIIPMVTINPALRERFGSLIVPAVVTLDAASLIILSIILRSGEEIVRFSIITFLALVFIISSTLMIPHIARWFFSRYHRRPPESELRFVLAILFYFIAVSSLLEIHGIVAAFIAGLILGETLKDDFVSNKLEAIGYGFLIPIFFINLGIETNMGILLQGTSYVLLVLSVIGTLIFSKIMGGMIFGRLMGMPLRDGLSAGIILLPQLSATLAAAEVGREMGIIPEGLFVSIIIMSITTATSTPFIVSRLFGRPDTVHFSDHIVILGGGRVGGEVLEYLLNTDESVALVDRSLETVRKWRMRWVASIYGDATDRKTLISVGVDRAKLVIVALPQGRDTVIAIKEIRSLNRRCRIIARLHSPREIRAVGKLVDVLIMPEKISAFNIVWHTHRLLDRDMTISTEHGHERIKQSPF